MNSKTIRNSAATFIAVGVVGYLSMSAGSVQRTLCSIGEKLGFCQSASAATGLAKTQDVASSCDAQASSCNVSTGDESGTKLTENERKIVDYVCNRIAAEGRVPAFSSAEIEKATGVSLEEINESTLKAAVLAELSRRNINADRLASASNCTKFSACSVDRDLSGATGEELARYTQEKSLDGQTFHDWYAPDFTLPTTAGHRVRLSEHRGKPVALVLLSGHCNHSHDTLPLLTELKAKYESQGLAILPVFVNSGSAEDIKSWSLELDLSYDLLVSESKDISLAYDSRMVPSTFLIDRQGRITKKYVGFKPKVVLDEAFRELASL